MLPTLALALTTLAAPPTPAEPADPIPLTSAEEGEMKGPCSPLNEGLVAWAKSQGNKPGKPVDVLRTQVAQLAPKLDPALRARCAELLIRGLQLYQQRVVEVEAKANLKSLATGMMSAFAENSSLCPSSDQPVPAKLDQLAGGPYHSTAADWAGAAWKCVGADFLIGEPQRFQYALHSDPKSGKVEITALGRSIEGGRIVKFILRGTVEGGTLKFAEVERH